MISSLTQLWTACSCLNAVFAFGGLVPRTQRSVVNLFSTAGQGGGIFYDGPQYAQSKQGESESTRSSSTSNDFRSNSKRGVQNKDVVIIGGGLAGLSAALYLSQLEPDRHITILEREKTRKDKTTVASFAAAGMLAPQSERLPKGPLLDLCVASRRLYPDFVDLVETLAQDEDGKEHLWSPSGEKPWSVGYVASGGFLAPAFAGDSVATWAPPEDSGSATWLDAVQVREMEPNLHPDVVGGWWFPEDASVDARRLTCSLRAACVAAGVHLQAGAEVTSLDLVDGRCRGLWLASGKYIKAKSVLVANGAWMRNLLPVPIEPHKGQSISLRMPPNEPAMLRRVLFAQDTYIVPKADGRIVVGATVEAGSYDANVTPAGLMHIMAHALQLVPGLADLPLEETWVGLRPTTPDKGPILGKTPWDNLFIAGGYWRNGVLLAPKTGQLLALLLSGRPLSSADNALLDAFAWDRFTSPEGSATMMANTRYAASMHPIHRRKSGSGVAAAVGTELGSYSTARSASEERGKDRSALFDSAGDDSAFERAAEMGRQDAGAYIYDNEETVDEKTELTGLKRVEQPRRPSLPEEASFNKFPSFLEVADESESVPLIVSSSPTNQDRDLQQSSKYEGSADAYTVQSQADDDEYVDLSFLYETIQANKASRGNVEMGEAEPDSRKDPGFRIYYVDPETGESREVPPFTSPEEMVQMVAEEKTSAVKTGPNVDSMEKQMMETPKEDYNEQTFDGYQVIQQANSRTTREEELEAMRMARQQNRLRSDKIDESQIGAQRDKK